MNQTYASKAPFTAKLQPCHKTANYLKIWSQGFVNTYQKLIKTLLEQPKVWLIAGVAGFIGFNLLGTLLKLNQTVVVLNGLLNMLVAMCDAKVESFIRAASRDFFFIKNTIQANLLAIITNNSETKNQVYKAVASDRTTLNQLSEVIHIALKANGVDYEQASDCRDFRADDISYSQTDVSKAKTLLSYESVFLIKEEIIEFISWYVVFLIPMQTNLK